MAHKIKNKSGVLFTVGAMALALAGLSTPSFAQDANQGRRGDRGGEARQDRGPRGDNGGRGGWQRGESRPAPAPAPAPRDGASSVRQNLPGWAGGTRNGEPVSRTNPPQTNNVRVIENRNRQDWRDGNGRPGNEGGWRGNDGRGGDNRWRDNDRRDNDRRDNDRRDNDNRWRDNDGRGRGDGWRDNDGRGRPEGWRGNDGGNGWRGNDGRWRDNDRRDNDRWRGSNGQSRSWDRNGWRRDNRYDWQSYRNRNRSAYRIGRYSAPYQNYSYRRLGIGVSLGSVFYGNRYWINDPWQYRLPAVYGPYRWVRYYDDVVLVDTYSGEVVDVIYDFFW